MTQKEAELGPIWPFLYQMRSRGCSELAKSWPMSANIGQKNSVEAATERSKPGQVTPTETNFSRRYLVETGRGQPKSGADPKLAAESRRDKCKPLMSRRGHCRKGNVPPNTLHRVSGDTDMLWPSQNSGCRTAMRSDVENQTLGGKHLHKGRTHPANHRPQRKEEEGEREKTRSLSRQMGYAAKSPDPQPIEVGTR